MLVSFLLEGKQDSEQKHGSGLVFFEDMFMMRIVVLVSDLVDDSERNEEAQLMLEINRRITILIESVLIDLQNYVQFKI